MLRSSTKFKRNILTHGKSFKKNVGHYTDEVTDPSKKQIQELGELKSFLRIIAFEKGCVIDGPIDPVIILKGMINAIDTDERFAKIIGIANTISKMSPGIARDMMLHVAILGAFSDSCDCEECVEKRRKRDMENLTKDISQN